VFECNDIKEFNIIIKKKNRGKREKGKEILRGPPKLREIRLALPNIIILGFRG